MAICRTVAASCIVVPASSNTTNILDIGTPSIRTYPRPSTGASVAPFRRVVIVSDGPNPTFDYYLAPRLAGGVEAIVAPLADPAALGDATLEGALLLFCRYCSPAWLARAERSAIAGAALLIDDDMPAMVRDTAMPLRYR